MASGLRQADNGLLFKARVADTDYLLRWKFSER